MVASNSPSETVTNQASTPIPPPIVAATGKTYQIFRVVPYMFLTIVGIFYAAGFLVVSSYLNSYGIRYSADEFWRARYIHIGFWCLSITILGVGTPLALSFIRLHWPKDSGSVITTRLGMFILLFLLWNFEAFILAFSMLTRRTHEADKPPGLIYLLALLVITILGIVVSRHFRNKIAESSDDKKETTKTIFPNIGVTFYFSDRKEAAIWVGKLILIGLSIVVAFLDVMIARPYFGMLGEMFKYQGEPLVFLLGCHFLLWFLPHRMFVISMKMNMTESVKIGAWGICFLLALPLLYVTIIAFSIGIYPYIPAMRGGGDYTDVAHVVAYLSNARVVGEFPFIEETSDTMQVRSPNARTPGSTQLTEREGGIHTKPLIVIEETPSDIFVALPDDADGPYAWRRKRKNRPVVYRLSRENIRFLRIVQPPSAEMTPPEK